MNSDHRKLYAALSRIVPVLVLSRSAAGHPQIEAREVRRIGKPQIVRHLRDGGSQNGAKGLNLATSDVCYAGEAFIAWFRANDHDAIAAYSQKALAGVWKSECFSWSLTKLMHRFPGGRAVRAPHTGAELDYIASSQAAQRSVAENYVGLPM